MARVLIFVFLFLIILIALCWIVVYVTRNANASKKATPCEHCDNWLLAKKQNRLLEELQVADDSIPTLTNAQRNRVDELVAKFNIDED